MSEESPTMQMLDGAADGEEVQEKQEKQEQKPQKEKVKAKSGKTDDLIEATAAEIEGISKTKAYNEIKRTVSTRDFDTFRMGGLLARFKEELWHEQYGYENFKAFVEAEVGVPYRKAMYWISIYTSLVESGVPWEKVKDVGWTKLKEMAGIITEDNVDEWVQRAADMTTLQLIDFIKALKKSKDTDEATDVSSKVGTLTFKVHTDQRENIKGALDKAKNEFGTEYDAVALDHMAVQYLTGTSPKVEVSVEKVVEKAGFAATIEALAKVFPEEAGTQLEGIFSKLGPEEVLTIFSKVFPNFNVEVEET